jgi:4-diphosphocytidyl-2-C-methyl-D-erythritol kinase
MLHVTDRYDNGYHHLQSIFVFASCGDEVSVSPDSELKLMVDGPFAHQLPADSSQNLVIKAINWLGDYQGVALTGAIHLRKNLPIASGIGGGSSDAAAAIAAFLPKDITPQNRLEIIKASGILGADVPICLAYQLGLGTAFWLDGSGTEGDIKTLALPSSLEIVLVNPGKSVLTSEIFKSLKRPYSDPLETPGPFITKEGLLEFLSKQRNDFEAPLQTLVPSTNDVLEAISSSRNNLIARVSGSGATCFGLYSDKVDAEAAAQKIQERHPDWWVSAASLVV